MSEGGTCLSLLNDMKQSRDASQLPAMLLDLFLSNQLGNEARLNILNEVFALSSEPEWLDHVQELLIDVIWLLDLESSESVPSHSVSASIPEIGKLQVNSNEESSALVSFVSILVQTGMLPFPLLLERLEPEFLQAIGVVASADLFNKKVIKINTSLFYRQQKFNLLREESEGFCRLVILLASSVNFTSQSPSIDLLYDRVLETIGFFDLDPLKVLDLLLENFVFGLHAWKDHLKLLSKFAFPSASIIGILGFKLKNVYGDVKFTAEYLEQVSIVIALLIANDFISLEAIWPHLKPSDDDCLQEFADFKAKIKESSSKLGVVNLSGSSTNNASTNANPSLTANSLTEQFAQDTLNSKLIPSLSSNRNLKAHLMNAFLFIGSADFAYNILCKFPHLAVLNSQKTSSKICSVIEHLLENKESSDVFLMGTLKFNEESGNVSNWLNLLPSGGLFHSPKLFSKLCKMLKTDGGSAALLQNHLIPALASSSHDSLILSQELWNGYIGALPYTQRYAIYGAWMDNLYSSSLFGPLIRANSIAEARKVMRRLAKENVRQYGRLVAKVTHSNPVVVLPLILDQLQAYDNIIPAVIEAFRFLTPLSFDILLFCLLRALSSSERDRLKEDGTNLAAWLQNLASFSAAIFRKYPQILDPAPLLRYIYSQLLDNNCLDVLVLQELLTQMAGIEKPENASEAVLEASGAGGPELLTVIKAANLQSLGLTGPSKRALSRLKTSLEAENLSVALLIALAQAADAVIYRMDYSHLKLVSTLTDTCNSAFLQYLEFLKGTMNTLEGVTLESLVKVNKLELPVALLIAKTFSLSINENNLKDLYTSIYKTQNIPSDFLKAFWSLNLSDISVPMSRYQQEITRLSASGAKKQVETLQAEMKEQVVRCGKARECLMQVKDSWFLFSEDRGRIVNSVLRMALLPRMLLGPMEAVHCAKFLFLLHSLAPPRFSTLSLLDAIFDSFPSLLLSSLTESESHCFGRFMHEIMLVMQAWQTSQEKYEREAISAHLPGFMKRWSHFLVDKRENLHNNTVNSVDAVDAVETVEEGEISTAMDIDSTETQTTSSVVIEETNTSISISSAQNENALSWQDFRHVLYKWHEKLFNTVLSLLTSTEYSSIRNTIIFLSHLSGGTFPRLQEASEKLEAAVGEIKAKESREDLKVLATRYSAMLIQNKPKLLKEHEFHFIENQPAATEATLTSSVKSSPGKKRGLEEPSSGNSASSEKRVKSSSERSERDSKERERDRTDNNKDNRGVNSKDRTKEIRKSELPRDSKDSRDDRERNTRESRDNRERDARDSRDGRTPSRSETPRNDRDRERDREREHEKEKEKERERTRVNERSSSERSSNGRSDRDQSRSSSSRRYEDTGRSRRH